MCMEDIKIMRESQVYAHEETADSGAYTRIISPNAERVTLSINGTIPPSDGINLFILTEKGRITFRYLLNDSATEHLNYDYVFNIQDHGAIVTAGFDAVPVTNGQLILVTEVTLPKK